MRGRTVEPRRGKGYEKPKKVRIQLIVTMEFEKMVSKMNLSCNDARNFYLRQVRHFTNSDRHKIAAGKMRLAPPRPWTNTLRFTVPTHIVAQRMRSAARLRKNSGLEA